MRFQETATCSLNTNPPANPVRIEPQAEIYCLALFRQHDLAFDAKLSGNCWRSCVRLASANADDVIALRDDEMLTYFDSLVIASAALPATTQLADPATTASSSNHRNPKSSMHSGKSGLMMMYPGITAPGM